MSTAKIMSDAKERNTSGRPTRIVILPGEFSGALYMLIEKDHEDLWSHFQVVPNLFELEKLPKDSFDIVLADYLWIENIQNLVCSKEEYKFLLQKPIIAICVQDASTDAFDFYGKDVPVIAALDMYQQFQPKVLRGLVDAVNASRDKDAVVEPEKLRRNLLLCNAVTVDKQPAGSRFNSGNVMSICL